MTKIPTDCKLCRRSKYVDPIQNPLMLCCRCKNTKNWRCPEKGIPEWCEEKRRSIENKTNGSHKFNCKRCGKLIRFSEILPHKKMCSPEEFKEHQSRSGKIGGVVTHKLHPDMAMKQWKKYLSNLKGETHGMFGKKHKLESIEKQRQAKLGKIVSEETKEKLSISKSGSNNPMYGIHLNVSEETRRKQSESLKGRPKSDEWKKKIGDANKGKEHPWCVGELNCNWNNGSSFEPYCPKFNFRLKEDVRIRDSHACQLCGVIQNGSRHTCHHIHYDKPNCYPDLVCLCRSCNAKVNFNRDYYEKLFMNKLNNRQLLFWTRRRTNKI